MAPGGRQSKRVRSIPLTEAVPIGSSRILKRLQTTRAHEQPIHEEISPIAGNSRGGDNAVQKELPGVAENTNYHEDLNNR